MLSTSLTRVLSLPFIVVLFIYLFIFAGLGFELRASHLLGRGSLLEPLHQLLVALNSWSSKSSTPTMSGVLFLSLQIVLFAF
jgi:hypothetical protein